MKLLVLIFVTIELCRARAPQKAAQYSSKQLYADNDNTNSNSDASEDLMDENSNESTPNMKYIKNLIKHRDPMPKSSRKAEKPRDFSSFSPDSASNDEEGGMDGAFEDVDILANDSPKKTLKGIAQRKSDSYDSPEDNDLKQKKKKPKKQVPNDLSDSEYTPFSEHPKKIVRPPINLHNDRQAKVKKSTTSDTLLEKVNDIYERLNKLENKLDKLTKAKK